MKKIQIKISNRGIYTLIASIILIIASVSVIFAVSSLKPNPGHDISEISGACASTSVGCDFLTNYYTKGEIDGKITDIQGTCNWEGWKPPKDCGTGLFGEGVCISDGCNLLQYACACDDQAWGYSEECCALHTNDACHATYSDGYECTNGVITGHEIYYYGCEMKADANCQGYAAE